MYPPAAVVVGGVISDAMDGRRLFHGIVLGGMGLMIVSPWSSVEFVYRLFLLVIGLGIVIAPWLSGFGREVLSRTDYETAKLVLPGLVVFVLVTSMIAPATPQGDPGLKSLGNEVARETPQDAEVYMDNNALARQRFFVFAFYSERRLHYATIDRINQDSSVNHHVQRIAPESRTQV
jgi:hypothetical protein